MAGSSLRLAFAGQSLLERPVATSTPSGAALGELLHSCDAAFTNLECAINGRHGGSPQRPTTLHVSPPSVLDTLTSFGFTLLALASNHAYDLGPEGILSALEEVERRGFVAAGTGRDSRSARRPGLFACGERRIGLVATNASPNPPGAGALDEEPGRPRRAGTNLLEVDLGSSPPHVRPEQLDALAQDVGELAAAGTLTIVYFHQHYWVPDVATTPAWLAAAAHRCVEAGAHVVVCHGPPLLHGLELYRGRPIFYGLGSFVFHTARPARYPGVDAWESIVAVCEFGRENALRRVELVPLVHGMHPSLAPDGSVDGAPLIAEGRVAKDLLERFAQRSLDRHGTVVGVLGATAVVEL